MLIQGVIKLIYLAQLYAYSFVQRKDLKLLNLCQGLQSHLILINRNSKNNKYCSNKEILQKVQVTII